MKELEFTALDYTSDDEFIESNYKFKGDESTGWDIFRNDEQYLHLDAGYRLLKTKSCGVCSTDIDRRFLPFPLPQVIGHEIIAQDPDTKEKFVVEINDTMDARGSLQSDDFIKAGIPTHSPERKVLGIDRLPGGFGPYILAPKNAIIPYSGISDLTAVLIEPFAAALQAITASPPKDGDRVAVLGPRRLGSLIISALNAYRASSGKKFTITALARRNELCELGKKLGADEGINVSSNEAIDKLKESFSIIYDTTASPQGFETAMKLAEREVHLKTTNGQEMGGVKHLTEVVVDELSILPFSEENLSFHWDKENRKNERIFISSKLTEDEQSFQELKNLILERTQAKVYILNIDEAVGVLQSKEFEGRLPRFDLAIVGDLEEIDLCIRPQIGKEDSLVRPRGAILVLPNDDERSLMKFLNRGGELHSSRCGDFHYALKLLQENPKIAESLSNNMISHTFSAKDLKQAYKVAQTPESIKVVVTHD
ncbi:MAG: alcohol dehydrogenase catalytic domain-containing protein [Leptospira sp.]|nr:alcohol dehydrogenase catalytic domain-containing protein [Leptospira sp.]